MPLIFANPLGFWALLGLPAVLLIHFLQREVRRETCTTLFLLEPLARQSASGNRFEWLRNSLPLWLQILAVLLLTWTLVEPRWPRQNAVQTVAFVLDSSASMQAFAPEARHRLLQEARALSRSAAQSEFFLLDSAVPSPALFRGSDLDALAPALQNWQPSRGLHDFTPALRIARNTAGRQGLVVLLTDHPSAPLPFDAQLLSLGQPTPNAGFAGLEVRDDDQTPVWKALVRNYSPIPQQRQWHLSAAGQSSAPQDLSLAPGEIRSIQGSFPPGITSFVLHLSPDSFPLDDVLPVLAPRARPLSVALVASERVRPLYESLHPALHPTEPLPDPGAVPDLTFHGYDPLSPSWPPGPALVFVDRAPKVSSPEAGLIIAADHPLLEDLVWDALILRPDLGIPFRPSDTPLLWLNGKPLVWLRPTPSASPSTPPSQLVLNFDPLSANAAKLPAFVLLLHRFAAQLRQDKISPEHRLAETHQIIQFPPHLDPTAFSARFTTWDDREFPLPILAQQLTLPASPGFAEIRYRDQPYLHLASHFADPRESGLSQATSAGSLAEVLPVQILRYSEAGFLTPLWILLLALALLASWAVLGKTARSAV